MSVRRRFAGALALSALLHTMITASLAPGSRARGEPAARAPGPIIVELTTPAPLPPAALPEQALEPTAAAPPAARKTRQPRALPHVHDSTRAEASGPAETPDPTYYAARQLDVFPALQADIGPALSGSAAVPDATGRVLLLVLIDANGRVDEVSVVEAEPAGLFDEDARRALLGARFTPARKGGRAVKSRLLVHVSYGSR